MSKSWVAALVLGVAGGCALSSDGGEAESSPLKGGVQWISPLEGDRIEGSVELEVDAPPQAAKLSFFVNGGWIGADRDGPPWSAVLDTTTLADGEHKLRAAARNAGGKRLDYATIHVTVRNEPDGSPPDDSGESEPPPDEEEDEGEVHEPGGHGDVDRHYAPYAEQPGACPAELHDARRWHPPVDPETGCYFGHEHGDDPDPYGYFADARVPEPDFVVLHDLVLEDHDGHHEAHAGNKVIYIDNGTPRDPSDDARFVYHQISVNRNSAPFYEKFVRDRDPAFDPMRFHSACLQMLGPGGKYVQFMWVDAVGDMHPRKHKKMPSYDSLEELQSLYDRDRDAAICRIKASCGSGGWPKESWYWVDFVSDRKEGLPTELWKASVTDRILNAPTYIDPDATGEERLRDLWTCEANGFDIDDPACPANGSMRYVDKALVVVKASATGVYWTDIYGVRVYGRGESPPGDCDGKCVRQYVGVTGLRSELHDRLMWYDDDGVILPN